MAGFIAAESAKDEEERKRKEREGSFKTLFAAVCEQKESECTFKLPRENLMSLRKNADWLDVFTVGESNGPAPLYANIVLPTKKDVRNIAISKDRISYDLNLLESGGEKLFTAFAMAIAAQSNKTMRKNGVYLEGDAQEQVFLLIAARKAGLTVKKPHKSIEVQAEQLMKGLESKQFDAAWKNFCHYMNECHCGNDPFAEPEAPPAPPPAASEAVEPKAEATDSGQDTSQPEAQSDTDAKAETKTATAEPETPPAAEAEPAEEAAPQPEEPTEDAPTPEPEPVTELSAAPQSDSLSFAFNRTIPADLRPVLDAAKVDAETYRKISEKVVESGQASRKFVTQNFKDAFNLTNNQIGAILETMDREGITAPQPGKARAVNFLPDGNPKPGF